MSTTTTGKSTAEDTSDADVTRAEQEAAEAAEMVSALEKRVEDGDEDVTPAQIAAQESLSRFAPPAARGGMEESREGA